MTSHRSQSPFRRLLLLLPAFVVALVALAIASLPEAAQGAPGDKGNASIDWSMPDRYGADGNGDGLVDSFAPDGPLEIDPSGFQVNFVASGGTACSGANTRTWSIEGLPISAGDLNVVGGDPASCVLSYRFPEEGTYEITIETRNTNGDVVARATKAVPVQDFLVVSIGDSVASGEGNPDIAGSAAAWQNEQCHRSALAGPARAAQAVETADPRTSVTFVHLACSGATVMAGLLGSYAGIVPGTLLPPQVDQLKNLVGNREIDALLVSIGANDLQFSKLVERCFIRPACDAGGPGSAAALFASRLPLLPGRYDALAAALGNLTPHDDRVLIAEYFDPTRDDAGQPCDGTILNDHPAGSPLFGITAAEAAWASNVMLTGLNAEVASAASRHGWEFVGGITSQFLNHGYCAADHWVVRWRESRANQGDINGTLHPNGAGQNAYGDRIATRMRSALYAGGNLQQPRRPEQRLEVQGRRAAGGAFADVVGPVDPGETVTIQARVNGPDNAGQTVNFALQGPGSISPASAATDANGMATISYLAPSPSQGEQARVIATMADANGMHTDSVGIVLVYREPTPTPVPTSTPEAIGNWRWQATSAYYCVDSSGECYTAPGHPSVNYAFILPSSSSPSGYELDFILPNAACVMNSPPWRFVLDSVAPSPTGGFSFTGRRAGCYRHPAPPMPSSIIEGTLSRQSISFVIRAVGFLGYTWHWEGVAAP